MDRAGLWLPQKKCAVMKTTFLHTKSLCSRGHAWLHVRRRPFLSFCCTQSHTLAHAQLVYCSDWIIQLFLTVYPSFYIVSIFVPKRIFAYLPSYSRIFCPRISGNEKPTPSDSHWYPMCRVHPLSKTPVISRSSQSHGVSNYIICTSEWLAAKHPVDFS